MKGLFDPKGLLNPQIENRCSRGTHAKANLERKKIKRAGGGKPGPGH